MYLMVVYLAGKLTVKANDRTEQVACNVQFYETLCYLEKDPYWHCMYIKCSKISNTNHLPKRSRQTGQTQIRLLLKKQSDQGLLCLLF